MSVPSFGVDVVVDQLLTLGVCDLMKMNSTSDLQADLFHQIMELDNNLLSKEHYLLWMRKLDKWCDNMTDITHTLRRIQMSVTKQRINTEDNVDHIDG